MNSQPLHMLHQPANRLLHTTAVMSQFSSAPRMRIPVKLHRRVAIVLTEDAPLAEELLARKKLAQEVAGRLSDRALLIRAGRVEAVVEELQKMGQTPQVVGR